METGNELTGDTTRPPSSDAAELSARSLEVLDFPAVRDQVAGHAGFSPARRLALAMAPAYVPSDVDRLQRETAEGLVLLGVEGDVALHATEDISSVVERAAPGGDALGA